MTGENEHRNRVKKRIDEDVATDKLRDPPQDSKEAPVLKKHCQYPSCLIHSLDSKRASGAASGSRSTQRGGVDRIRHETGVTQGDVRVTYLFGGFTTLCASVNDVVRLLQASD
jgi:hypothetical protein